MIIRIRQKKNSKACVYEYPRKSWNPPDFKQNWGYIIIETFSEIFSPKQNIYTGNI